MSGTPERLPESEVIFQDTSVDGSLLITIWRDHTPQTDLMRENKVASMGILSVYDLQSTEMVHKERVPLSESTITGCGPTEDEVKYWSDLVAKYMPKE